MRFLIVNHLRLGRLPVGIPAHTGTDVHTLGGTAAWMRIATMATNLDIHAVMLCGETIAAANPTLEPWGPLQNGLRHLAELDIPVIAVPYGDFTPSRCDAYLPDTTIHWIDPTLNWEPPFTTAQAATDDDAVRILPEADPATIPSGSMAIAFAPAQPQILTEGETIVLAPGSVIPSTPEETDIHGAWLIDTETRKTELIPVAGLAFVNITIDISATGDTQELEQHVVTALTDAIQEIVERSDIITTVVFDARIVGVTAHFAPLHSLLAELEQLLIIQIGRVSATLGRVRNEAEPAIDLATLVDRPDPIGEIARLVAALHEDRALTEPQVALIDAADRRLLGLTHSRAFASIQNEAPRERAQDLLRRQGWRMLDTLLRERGID